MTLAELQNYVRVQTETTSAELPNSTINSYLREAFNRTYNSETRWPFYENDWTLTQAIGDSSIPMPSDLDRTSIIAIIDPQQYDYRLTQLAFETANDRFTWGLSGSAPSHYSLWGSTIYLWPAKTYEDERTYTLLGYRTPSDWVTLGDPPDIDEALHYPLAHYAIALAYAQQEDELLETQYMIRWQNDFEVARRKILSPSVNSPIRMGGGRGRFEQWL